VVKGALDNLCALEGVRGAALFDRDGQCLEAALRAPYEVDFVSEVLTEVLDGLEVLGQADGRASRAAFARAEHGCIGVLRTEQHALIALTDQGVEPNHLWVAFGALEAKLSRLDELPRQGSFVSSSDLPRPEAPVPGEVLEALEAALSREVGPVARVLLLDELNALGATATSLDEGQLPELVRRLEQGIERATQRRSFRSAVAPLLGGAGSNSSQ